MSLASPSWYRAAPALPWSEMLLRRAVLGRLASLGAGRLTVCDPWAAPARFGGGEPGPAAELTVREAAFYPSVALRGSIGAAESYMRGEWTADDLVALVRLFVRNHDTMWDVERGLARLARPFFRLFQRRRGNTVTGSRENIAAHYDLGNEFFQLFLDPTLMYSSAYFERDEATLEEASVAKVDRICRKLDLGPDDHLLEIGTGWGYLALHAARRYGCRVTTTTISAEQHRAAGARIREAGLEDRVTLLQRDYRELAGRYDKLVSVEMIEAVGHEHFETFFRTCAGRLEPDGRMLLQAIVIQDRFYEAARRSVDFIKRYVFPGSCLPSVGTIADIVGRATDLRITQLEDITGHYAHTLCLWRERFLARLDEVRAQGYPETFIRLWELYLAYCEAGFRERYIGDVQIVFARPGCRAEPTAV